MRLACLLSCTLTMGAALASATPGPTMAVEFAAPAQLEGQASVDGLSWVLLVFGPADEAAAQLDIPGPATAVNHSMAFARASHDGVEGIALPAPLGSQRSGLDGPLEAALGLGGRWSSLFVRARHITLEAELPGELGTTSEGDTAASRLLAKDLPTGTYRPASLDVDAGQVAVASLPANASSPISVWVRAEGVHTVEWHNAEVACPAGQSCPDGARDAGRNFGDGEARLLSYTEVLASGASLAGAGRAHALAAGGPSLGLGLAGSLRLPDAALACQPEPCPHPPGATFRAQGAARLDRLEAVGPGRLRADLGGSLAASASDERVWLATPAAAAVGAAVVGLGALAWLALALFARRPGASLSHPRAQALLDLIRGKPGLSLQELLRQTGWPNGTVRHHLRKMRADGHIVCKPYRNTLRFFENHGRHEATWQSEVVLQDAEARRLLAWIQGHPGVRQASIVAAARAWGWPRSKAQRRLQRLVEAGLVARQGAGTATYAA